MVCNGVKSVSVVWDPYSCMKLHTKNQQDVLSNSWERYDENICLRWMEGQKKLKQYTPLFFEARVQ